LDVGQFESLIIRCHLFIRVAYFLAVNSACNAVFVEGNLTNEIKPIVTLMTTESNQILCCNYIRLPQLGKA
jgi:hypothetical protein